MNSEYIKFIGKVAAIQTLALLTSGEHPSYVLEKSDILCNPIPYGRLDSTKRAELDGYFRKWDLEEEWNEYKKEVEKDWQDMPAPEFARKYHWENCKFEV